MANQHATNADIKSWQNPINVVETLSDDGSYISHSSKYLLISESGLVPSGYNNNHQSHQPNQNHESYSTPQVKQLHNIEYHSQNILDHDKTLKQSQQQLHLHIQQQQQQQQHLPLKNDSKNPHDLESSRYQIALPVNVVGSNHYLSNHPTDVRTDDVHNPQRYTPTYVVEGIGLMDFIIWIKYACGFILASTRFKILIIIAIIINALSMGIETFPIIANNPQRLHIFQTADLSFLILFTIELVMHIFYRGFGIFRDSWVTFDFLVIITSWVFSQLQIIRAFRVLRVLRLIARLKGLQDIVEALISVIPRMFAIVGLMTLVYYIYAVMFTQLFGSAYEEGITTIDYFSRLDKTWFSLFQLMTLDSWSTVTRELMTAYPWAWLPMMSYVMSTSFIVINLVIAVICDGISKVTCSDDVKEEADSHHVLKEAQEKITRLERKIDNLTSLVQELVSCVPRAETAIKSTEGYEFT